MRPLYFIGLLIYSAVSIVVTPFVYLAVWAKANQVEAVACVILAVCCYFIYLFFPNAFDQYYGIGGYEK